MAPVPLTLPGCAAARDGAFCIGRGDVDGPTPRVWSWRCSFRRVVAEEELPCTFRIRPTDDEFLAVEAFDLEPGAPVGLVAAVYPLRHNSFWPVLAGKAVECRPSRR
jgi:hypothetical protein